VGGRAQGLAFRLSGVAEYFSEFSPVKTPSTGHRQAVHRASAGRPQGIGRPSAVRPQGIGKICAAESAGFCPPVYGSPLRWLFCGRKKNQIMRRCFGLQGGSQNDFYLYFLKQILGFSGRAN